MKLIRAAAQLYPVRFTPDERVEVFMGKRITTAYNNMWSSSGGNLDLNDGLINGFVNAALREGAEEFGVHAQIKDLHFLRNTILRTTTTEGQKRIYGVQAFMVDATNLVLTNQSPDEFSKAHWIKADEALALHEEKGEMLPKRGKETIEILAEYRGSNAQELVNFTRVRYRKFLKPDENLFSVRTIQMMHYFNLLQKSLHS